jgi:hypothetical protein
MEDQDRHIFDAWQVLDRRKSAITAVAVDHTGSRLFLGLEDGVLEEYALINRHNGTPYASLTAKKPITLKVSAPALPRPPALPRRPRRCSV